MKKILLVAGFCAVFAVLGMAGLFVAGAQTAANSAGVNGSGYATPGYVVSPPSIPISSTPDVSYPTPIMPPVPIPPESGFIQFNNLTVQSVSGTNPPADSPPAVREFRTGLDRRPARLAVRRPSHRDRQRSRDCARGMALGGTQHLGRGRAEH